MHQALFMLLRRLRGPLIWLIVVYAVAVLGLVLIPGVDAQGQPWRMGFFHAFYVVSYTATTIGFGELPYPFTEAQRLWLTAVIYVSVVTWLYTIGALLGVVQDPAFRAVGTEAAFARTVRRLRDPFYLICGYGDTGSLLVRALAAVGLRAVVLDASPERIGLLELEDLPLAVPGLRGDASQPDTLRLAGLEHPRCQGVIAVTHSDAVNLKVSITAKLLRPGLPVICRADTVDAANNMASFGTDHIVNAFETFAGRLARALHAPALYLLYEWMTAAPYETLREPIFPPGGRWVLCGYGRFGKAVLTRLERAGLAVTVIEADPARTQPPPGSITGRGTEADTLLQAGIREAAGIIAGTDDDANNLSIVMTARALNPRLFVVGRQNQRQNADLFAAAGIDLIMQRPSVIAHKIFALITTPLLTEFLLQARQQDNDWASQMVSRISGVTGEAAPETWGLRLTEDEAPALHAALASGLRVCVGDLWRDPRNRQARLPGLVLLAQRGTNELLAPADDFELQPDDHLLLCGTPATRAQLGWITGNPNALAYLVTGRERPAGWLWERLARH